LEKWVKIKTFIVPIGEVGRINPLRMEDVHQDGLGDGTYRGSVSSAGNSAVASLFLGSI
jgi:hypothetical protein